MKKGLKPLILGTLTLFIGIVIIPFGFIVPRLKTDTERESFLIPGEHQITVEKEGQIYLWNDYQTVHDGRTYDQPEKLPDGLQFQINNPEGESLLFFNDSSATATYTTPNRTTAKRSIGYFDVTTPGTYTISVAGSTEQRVFSYSDSLFPKKLIHILIASACCFLFVIFGLGMTIYGIVTLTKKSKSARSVPPPPLT